MIEALNNLSQAIIESGKNNYFWTAITAICAIISAGSVFLLLKEMLDKNRPYLQIDYEQIRSTLACIVIRNVGTVPLTLTSLKLDEEFTEQLDSKKISSLKRYTNTKINIFPNRFFVISLDKNVFDIINDFKVKNLKFEYQYKKLNNKKPYVESNNIDFEEFGGFLVYQSELDEFKNSTDKIVKSLEEITTYADKFEKIVFITKGN